MRISANPTHDNNDSLSLNKSTPNITVNDGAMRAASETGFLNATDLADYLAVKGMPFREAHSVSGKAVAWALEQGRELHELTVEEFKKFSSLIEPDIFDFLSTDAMIKRRITYGGTGFDTVKAAIERAGKEMTES